MKTESGQEVNDLKPVQDVTLAEATALVDSWDPGGKLDFKIHKVARVLRAELAARLEQRDVLQATITAEINRRRATEACYVTAADQVHALRQSLGRIAERLAAQTQSDTVFVAKDYTRQDLIQDLRAMAGDPHEPRTREREK